VPILLFNFVGFEPPNTAGDEIPDPQQDVPYAIFRSAIFRSAIFRSAIFRSAILSMLRYGLPILGILLVLPTEAVTSLGGFINAIKSVFTVYGGNAAKLFRAVLAMVISTTLVSYIGIFPALIVLRHRRPNVGRPYKAPFPLVTSILLTALVVFSAAQLLAPGRGSDWFGSEYLPAGWATDEKWCYLETELIPLLIFVIVGFIFWVSGRGTRERLATTEELATARENPVPI
jgi:amino acid transporter